MRKFTILAGLVAGLIALPAGAEIYLRIPGGQAAQSGAIFTIAGLRWEAKGETRAVRASGALRYRAEGGTLVRVESEGDASAMVQRLARPLRRPEHDPAAVLTRPVRPGPGMLAVRGVWRDCREGVSYPVIELREVSGGGSVVLEEARVVACAGDSFAFNYERIGG